MRKYKNMAFWDGDKYIYIKNITDDDIDPICDQLCAERFIKLKNDCK